MKIVIFHDFFGAIGGGEKTVLTLARALDADVVTTDINRDAIEKMGFGDVNFISLGETIKMPPLKQISASAKFARCEFSNRYDFFIISGNWAHFAAKRHKPNLLYCHTPVRAFYDLYDTFLKRQSFVTRILFRMWVAVHKPICERYMNHVGKIVVNSVNTQSRIKRYLHRDAEVIYPPINITKYKFEAFGDFWLSINRLYPEKRLELQIEAFRQMPEEELIIVGGYAEGDHASKYAERIKHNLPKNVELRGEVTEEELIDLYASCKGYITTAMDEDFGMTPIEAMAAGKPVVAVKEGGYLESVVDGVTGVLVEADVESIVNAVGIIPKEPEVYRKACQERARMFDGSIFIKRMKEAIEESV